jgi:hypothetical protein
MAIDWGVYPINIDTNQITCHYSCLHAILLAGGFSSSPRLTRNHKTAARPTCEVFGTALAQDFDFHKKVRLYHHLNYWGK